MHEDQGSKDSRNDADSSNIQEPFRPSHSNSELKIPEAKKFIQFAEQCGKRLSGGHGHGQYGSHHHEQVDLLRELEWEILDMANYAYFMWLRLDKIRKEGRDVFGAKSK